MDENAVRELLVTECRRLLAEWQTRQQKPWYGRRHEAFDLFYLEDTEFSKEWPDYVLLAGAMSYLDNFVHSVNHGDHKFDHRTWDEAISELEEIATRLEASRHLTEQTRIMQ